MFGKGIKLFELFGFEVKIDWSWIIIAVLITWSLSTGYFPFAGPGYSTGTYWAMGIVGALGLFFSVIVHELTHSIVARSRGMPMKGITLFIFGGVAEMGDEPPDAKTEFMMAIVGPLSSIVLGLVFYGISKAGAGFWPPPVTAVLWYLALINWILAAFNLLPAFPLDGGRVLRSILWGAKGSLKWATRVSSSIGMLFGFLLIGFGLWRMFYGNFFGGMWMILIGMFLESAARTSYQQLIAREALKGEPVRRFMNSSPVTVAPSVSVDHFVEDYVYRHHYKMFPVVSAGDLVGCVSVNEVKEIPREEWKYKTVGELSTRCSTDNTIPPEADAARALSVMSRTGKSRLMVVDRGQLLGIIALKDMLHFISQRMALEE